jgi:hypothetical protein
MHPAAHGHPTIEATSRGNVLRMSSQLFARRLRPSRCTEHWDLGNFICTVSANQVSGLLPVCHLSGRLTSACFRLERQTRRAPICSLRDEEVVPIVHRVADGRIVLLEAEVGGIERIRVRRGGRGPWMMTSMTDLTDVPSRLTVSAASTQLRLATPAEETRPGATR